MQWAAAIRWVGGIIQGTEVRRGANTGAAQILRINLTYHSKEQNSKLHNLLVWWHYWVFSCVFSYKCSHVFLIWNWENKPPTIHYTIFFPFKKAVQFLERARVAGKQHVLGRETRLIGGQKRNRSQLLEVPCVPEKAFFYRINYKYIVHCWIWKLQY